MRFPYSLPFLLLHLIIISSAPVASLNFNPIPFLKAAFNFSYLPYTLVTVGRDGRPTTLTISFKTITLRDQTSTTSQIMTTTATTSQDVSPIKPTSISTTKGNDCVWTVTKRRTVTKNRTAMVTTTVTERPVARTQTVTKLVTTVSTVKETKTVRVTTTVKETKTFTKTVYIDWFDGDDIETVIVTEWIR
ncbi:hypothetical protein TWF102_004736 [Orbilia oligospora]|uniref:Uncharacterized protein n=1 Tax=Orbilia oligospora TaxID=2813651 RepID=A0A7C8NJG5_ORBOL|nr:hypothetical protein TWF103_004281 [Orbilia oligospora]KAF3080284.1 hypothetical protein TWF706_002791 [Orbilia oligospora]KAF3102007.1 hypothetical protein TWF102_004736 [Orbilia oligospora]KAF3125838.1 hypothetical protein TWF703_010658 [Orbilia oligospora]KAF3144493.1 hypothetical protein TWF594_004658 [Orbilia oligospora]